MPRIRFRTLPVRISACLAAALPTVCVHAAPHAFVSVPGPENTSVKVIDLETMAVETTIGGIGDEPGRMVANADRSMIWLSSWRNASPQNEGLVYRIDTRLRQVVASQVVGLKQNRTIALSPDESRVYTWKQTFENGVGAIGVAVLDAMTLAELAVVPIEGPSCLQFSTGIAVSPDGRIVAAGCGDGLRIIDPVTLVVSIGSMTPLGASRLLGFSPDGAEVYVPTLAGVSANNTGVHAIHLDTGVGNDFYWAGGGPSFPSNTGISRMIVVQRPSDPVGDPTVFFTYASAFGNPPVAWARASDLVPAGAEPRQRRLLGRVNVGPASSLGAAPDGAIGLGARIDGVRRLAFDESDDIVIAPDGDIVSLTGVGPQTDIIVPPPPVDLIFADGFD